MPLGSNTYEGRVCGTQRFERYQAYGAARCMEATPWASFVTFRTECPRCRKHIALPRVSLVQSAHYNDDHPPGQDNLPVITFRR